MAEKRILPDLTDGTGYREPVGVGHTPVVPSAVQPPGVPGVATPPDKSARRGTPRTATTLGEALAEARRRLGCR